MKAFFVWGVLMLNIGNLASVVSQNSVESQQNAAVGDRVVLECYTAHPSPVRWMFMPDTGDVQEISAHGMIFNGHARYFELDSSVTGYYNLVIRSATRNNTGLYVCDELNGLGDRHLIRLTVVVTRPSADTIIKTTSVAADDRLITAAPTGPADGGVQYWIWMVLFATLFAVSFSLNVGLIVFICVNKSSRRVVQWTPVQTGPDLPEVEHSLSVHEHFKPNKPMSPRSKSFSVDSGIVYMANRSCSSIGGEKGNSAPLGPIHESCESGVDALDNGDVRSATIAPLSAAVNDGP